MDGYAPLRDYAVIGDGRCAALVARDGSVDWLGLPDLDSPTVFAAVVDAARGGRFALEPEVPYQVARRYLSGTNVLQTMFTTAGGTVRVTDALTLEDDAALTPMRELQRRIDGVTGTVSLRWSVQPRFGYGTRRPVFTRRAGVPVATAGSDALAVCAWDAGEPAYADGAIGGHLDLRQGQRALIAMPAWNVPAWPGDAGWSTARTRGPRGRLTWCRSWARCRCMSRTPSRRPRTVAHSPASVYGATRPASTGSRRRSWGARCDPHW